MPKKLTYKERFKRLKENIKNVALSDFFVNYNEMKEIEKGLVEEEKEKWNKEVKVTSKD